MANYTMELRRIIEYYTQDNEDMKRKERIKKGTAIFFSEIDYPFYDDKERVGFQERFVMNFFLNEIGYETPAMFSLYLENWLNQNMPYWNQVYKSAMIEYDPLTNVDYSTITDRDKTQDVDTTGTRLDKNKRVDVNSKNNTTDYNDNKDTSIDTKNDSNKVAKKNDKGTTTNDVNTFERELLSDTPQNDLQITPNTDGSGVVRYASSIKENKGSNNGKGTSSNIIDTSSDEKETGNEKGNEVTKGNIENDEKENKSSNVDNDRLEKSEKDLKENEKIEEIKKGKIGVTDYADMITKQRNTFLRIEKQIFKEMKRDGLFMLVYSI